MTLRLSKAVQLLHRPHLIRPKEALEFARRIRSMDARGFERASGPWALFRRMGLALGGKPSSRAAGRPAAMEDDEAAGQAFVAPTRPAAYAPWWMGEPDARLETGWSVKDSIGMMEISGPLVEHGGYVGECFEWYDGYDTIAQALTEFDADGSVKAGIIRFDTPGGVVASGLDELSAMFQARGPDAKPIWAHCEMACSAGYWIASQCARVLAPKTGLIGSIGAVMAHENYAGALEKMGIEITTIEFPEGGQKTAGAFWKALSEEERVDLQVMINDIGESFLATVHAGRGDKLSPDKARGLRARVFGADSSEKGHSALALGLIDGVMSERAAFEALSAEISANTIIQIPEKSAGLTAARAATKPASAGASMETDMKLRAALLAVLAKAGAKTSDEKLAEIRKILDEEEEQEAEGEEEETEAEGDEEETEAAAEGDEEEEDEADASARVGQRGAAVDPKVAQAILDLPEASGRDKLARRLAFKPGMTVAEAKADLVAAPKERRLAGNVVDPKISAEGGPALSKDDQLVEAGFAAAGIKPLKRA